MCKGRRFRADDRPNLIGIAADARAPPFFAPVFRICLGTSTETKSGIYQKTTPQAEPSELSLRLRHYYFDRRKEKRKYTRTAIIKPHVTTSRTRSQKRKKQGPLGWCESVRRCSNLCLATAIARNITGQPFFVVCVHMRMLFKKSKGKEDPYRHPCRVPSYLANAPRTKTASPATRH